MFRFLECFGVCDVGHRIGNALHRDNAMYYLSTRVDMGRWDTPLGYG